MPTPPTDKREVARRARRAKSFRQSIASAIARRMATGEALSIRSIIAEAGGGSADTVREELAKVSAHEAARLLHGDALRSSAEREAALRDQLQRCERERATLAEANKHLVEALRASAKPSAVLEHQVAEIGAQVRGALGEVLREAARLRRMREKGSETVIVPDALLEARHQRLVQEHAALIERYQRLRTLYHEATGEFFEP